MKKLASFFCLVCTFLTLNAFNASSAQAYTTWQANAYISVNQLRVTATVVNQSFRPVVCSGYVYGQIQFGPTLNSWMNHQVIYPGQHANIYVYTNYAQPFVNGWADIRCQYL